MTKDVIYRQAAIDALAELKKKHFDHPVIMRNVMNAIQDLPSAQPEQRWIPVTERLPEDEYVLISKKPTKLSGSKWCVTVAIRMADPRSRKIQWRDSGFGIIQDDEVLAWMPRPKPYRKEGEENG